MLDQTTDPRLNSSLNDRIGQLVQGRRRALGWSLSWLSARMDACGGPSLSTSTLSRFERGFVRLDVREASALCRALGISFHTLAATMQVRRIVQPEAPPSSLAELYERSTILHARCEFERLLELQEWAWDNLPLDAATNLTDSQEERARLALFIADTYQRLDLYGMSAYFNRLVRRHSRQFDLRISSIAQHAYVLMLAGDTRRAELLNGLIPPAVSRVQVHVQAYLLLSLGSFEFRRGNYGAVAGWIEPAIPIWQDQNQAVPINLLRGRGTMGFAALLLGRRTEGLRVIESVIADAQAVNCVTALLFADTWLERLGITL